MNLCFEQMLQFQQMDLKQPLIHLATTLSDGSSIWGGGGGAVYLDRSGTFKIILQEKNEGINKGEKKRKDSSPLFWGRVSQGTEQEMVGCLHLAGM